MKKSKKGFIFIETIVTVAVLTVSLLMVYSSYSSLIIKEKNRITFNDSVYLYRAYYIEKFFRNFNLYELKDYMNSLDNTALVSFGCSASIFRNEEDNMTMCNKLISDYNVSKIYLTYKDLGFLQYCKDSGSSTGSCEVLMQASSTMINYLLSIGGTTKTLSDAKQKNEYRIVIEFKENKDGTSCTSDCKYYYASISIGELES